MPSINEARASRSMLTDTIVRALIEYILPEVIRAYSEWKKKDGPEPTVEDLRRLMEGVRPPGDY